MALHAAASTADRVAFHILNRRTGHRVHRVYVDAETEKPVEHEDQVKGYETDSGRSVVLEPEEIAAAVPESDKVLSVEAFIPCSEVDTLYFDRPYYLTPAEASAETAFAVIRDGLAKRKVAAVARTVLFRRVRSVMIRSVGEADGEDKTRLRTGSRSVSRPPTKIPTVPKSPKINNSIGKPSGPTPATTCI